MDIPIQRSPEMPEIYIPKENPIGRMKIPGGIKKHRAKRYIRNKIQKESRKRNRKV